MSYLYMPSASTHSVPLARKLRDETGTSPCIWLGDRRTYQEAQAAFPDTEFVDWEIALGHSISLGSFSPQVLDTVVGYWDSEEFEREEPLLLGEFSRFPRRFIATEPDRSVALRRIQLSIAEKIVRLRPMFLLASETPHNPYYLSTYFLCRWLGIPRLHFQPAWSIGPLLQPRIEIDQKAEPVDWPRGFPDVQDFLANTAVQLTEKMSSGATSLQRFEKSAASFHPSQWRLHAIRARDRLNSAIRGNYLEEWLISRAQKKLRQAYSKLPESGSGVSSSYVLLALHYQPERTSIPEGAPLVQQADFVARVRSFVPEDIRLAVKEHENTVARHLHGYQARSPDTYRLINSFPNTWVFRGSSDTSKLVTESQLVVTMTGSIGIQAVLSGVPCVYLGNPWWSGLPGTVRLDRGLSYEEVVDAGVPAPEEILSWLKTTVGTDLIPGWGTPSQEVFWRQSLDLPESFDEAALASQLAHVRALIELLETERKIVGN